MFTSRKTALTMEIQVMKSEHTNALPIIQELHYDVADINHIVVGWHPDSATTLLSADLDLEPYVESIQLNGLNPQALFAKQFASANLSDIEYTGPRFQILAMEYKDSLTGATYKIPKHRFRKVNQLLAQVR